MRISPIFQALGITGALFAGAFIACQQTKSPQKPMHTITLTQPGTRWFAEYDQNSFPAKMEEGCSYENNKKIYIMGSDGKLHSIDKETGEEQIVDTIKFDDDYESRVFQRVALYNQNSGDTVLLSKDKIELSQKYPPYLEGTINYGPRWQKKEGEDINYGPRTNPGKRHWKPNINSFKIVDGIQTKITTVPGITVEFKYNQDLP